MNTTSDKNRIDFILEPDFLFIQNYFHQQIKTLLKDIESSDDCKRLIFVGKKAFNLDRFVDDMSFFGYPRIAALLEEGFFDHFQSKYILKDIQKRALSKALTDTKGQKQIGENNYVVLDNKYYLRTLKGAWYEIDWQEVYLLLPTLNKKADDELANHLNEYHKPSEIDELFTLWQTKNYAGSPDELIRIETKQTTPEEYFKNSLPQIEKILNKPVSLDTLEKYHGQDENYLESLIKVAYRLINFVIAQRKTDSFPVYLLRDGLMFAETQEAIDLLKKEPTPSAQIMISRKTLSSPNQDEYYWNLTIDALYLALREHPDDFDQFYSEYSKLIGKIESENPDFQKLVENLANYIQKNISKGLNQDKKILVIDTGLQGSINLFTKYIIDNKLSLKNDTDIRLFVAGDWFQGVYKGKFLSDYYPMMKDIEIFERSDSLYYYKKGSFENGNISVEMGSKENQKLANIELIVLVTLCKIMFEKNLLCIRNN